MMLNVLQPWEPAWLVCPRNGQIRRPKSCHGHRISSGFPLQSSRFMSPDHWHRRRSMYPRRHGLDELFDELIPSSLMFGSLSMADNMIEDSDEFDRSLQRWETPCRALCEGNNKSSRSGLLKPIQWRVNAARKEARAIMQLPPNLKASDDLNVELDEDTRTITLKATSVYGSHNRGVSTWEYSQRLDDSIDLDKLEASVDIRNSALHLKAPIQAGYSIQNTRRCALETKRASVTDREDIGSEEEHPPQSDTEISSDDDSQTEIPTNDTSAENDTGSTIGKNAQNAIEIEDVGPDGESDRISTTSRETE